MNAPDKAPLLARPAPEFQHFKVTPCTPNICGLVKELHLSALHVDSAAELQQALWH
jgi:hypothetical protein